ncbi:MAG: hypothetical protein ISR96_04655 [Nitrospira sp.]|nr:hypothetical protein [bacterium]MBL7048794.1 hypothetical protein [Nitrospira sp.]
MESLLAVDAGLRAGLALYSRNGRLCWYRSKNFGTNASLKRGAHALLGSIPDLKMIVIEGGGTHAVIWEREALRRKLGVKMIHAGVWRQKLLYPREQKSGQDAKHFADDLARRTIEWSEITRPTSLRHDAAEAILIGLWAVLDEGWLETMPKDLRR